VHCKVCNIFSAFPQRRKTQSNDIEPMKKVFSKLTIANALLKVLVSRSNNANVGLKRLMPANTIVMTIR
jgi:hypothetical protein